MSAKGKGIGTVKRKIGLGAALTLLLASAAYADEKKPTLAELSEKVGLLERKLELSQEEAVSKAVEAKKKFDVAVYGRVKLDAAYDSARTSAGDFVGWVLPKTPEADNELNATARDSRFGVRVRAPDFNKLVTTGVIETDFLSTGPANSPNPRLRLAYFDVAHPNGWSIRLGQDWDLFATYHPNTVDPGALGNSGNPRGFRPQARVSKTIQVSESTKWVATAALTRNIGQDLDAGGQDDGSDTGVPAAQASLAFHAKGAAGRPLTVAVSGLYGPETLDEVSKSATTNAAGVIAESVKIVGTDDKDYDSWLLHLAVILPLNSKLALQGVAWTGSNLDAYQGGIGQGVNAAAGKEVGAQGGYLQLTANVTEKVTLGAGYGIDDPEDDDLAKGARTKNSRVYGNAVYALTPAASVGVEVSQIATDYKEQDDADAVRVAFSGQFRF